MCVMVGEEREREGRPSQTGTGWTCLPLSERNREWETDRQQMGFRFEAVLSEVWFSPTFFFLSEGFVTVTTAFPFQLAVLQHYCCFLLANMAACLDQWHPSEALWKKKSATPAPNCIITSSGAEDCWRLKETASAPVKGPAWATKVPAQHFFFFFFTSAGTGTILSSGSSTRCVH